MNTPDTIDPSTLPSYYCEVCDREIPQPGVGHTADCYQPKSGVEYLRYQPATYIVSDGKYYPNLEGGSMRSRRIPKDLP